jgi:hypothetical protein
MGVVGKVEKGHVISGVLEQQISARTSAELKTYFEGELGNVEKGSCSHDSYFNTMYLLSDKNRAAIPDFLYALQLSNISSPGQIAQEVQLEKSDFRFFSTVFNPLTEEVYLLSCDSARVRVERIPTTSGYLAGSTYTSLKTEEKGTTHFLVFLVEGLQRLTFVFQTPKWS